MHKIGGKNKVDVPHGRIVLARVHLLTMSVLGLELLALMLQLWLGSRTPMAVPLFATAAIFAILGLNSYNNGLGIKLTAQQDKRIEAAHDAEHKVTELFAMTDMLQAAETYDDTAAVLMATAQRLLPDYGVALYVFNNSRDRLDLARSWDMPDGFVVSPALVPANCWALQRGKPHVNAPHEITLCCAHHTSDLASIEIPMMACGQLHGLLIMALGERDGAFQRLRQITRVGRALADSMSLALSNIALREKLRTQSLRDPLTGLYNRRYMEDALERFIALGAQSGAHTSVLMIDLDNFKRLNDDYGHAKGDAVLRDVAAQLVGSLRPSDVVCRYGGEELVAILPDCSLDDALERAESVRQRIEALGHSHQCSISASFGVATVPETAMSAIDVLPIADAALFCAKRAGKNQVHGAERRGARDQGVARLAAVRIKSACAAS